MHIFKENNHKFQISPPFHCISQLMKEKGAAVGEFIDKIEKSGMKCHLHV